MGLRLLWIALSLAVITPAQSFALGSDYVLGAQDKLEIRVFDWRTPTGDAHEWKALSGTFTVNASGDVSLPLIGDIPASGETTAALGQAISERLQSKIGLAQKPVASVEVTQYRPFFVLGRVTTPGAYPFRPNLTAIQALSVAGGIFRGLARDGNEADLITRRGDLRLYGADKVALVIKQARLEAELHNDSQVAFPPEILKASSDDRVARLMKEEKLLFEVRQQAFVSKITSMNATKEMLLKEVEVLRAKSASLSRQAELAKKELENVNNLVSKGLAVSSRQLSMEQNAAQYESAQLDVSLSMLRAQQDASKIDRDIADLRGRQQSEVLTDLNLVRQKLSELGEKLQTTAALIDWMGIDPSAVAREQTDTYTPSFWVTRRTDGSTSTFQIGANDPVLPGDVVDVRTTGDENRERTTVRQDALNATASP